MRPPILDGKQLAAFSRSDVFFVWRVQRGDSHRGDHNRDDYVKRGTCSACGVEVWIPPEARGRVIRCWECEPKPEKPATPALDLALGLLRRLRA